MDGGKVPFCWTVRVGNIGFWSRCGQTGYKRIYGDGGTVPFGWTVRVGNTGLH